MPRIAIIGSGPTGIYTLNGLIASSIPLSITVFEETPDAGKGTPYHPAVNDRAMLANISSPWPAAAIKRIGPVKVGILGTSLSGIDAVVSVATAHGTFLRDQEGTLQYSPNPDSAGFDMTMMSRKGLLPEADFYCEMPYQALRACTEEAVKRLIAEKPERLLDEVFELFKQEIALADPEYAAAIGLSLATIDTIADRYFRARQKADPFVWAAFNLVESKRNKVERCTVQWRYAILRMHEVVALAVPHFNDRDLKRFHEHFKTVFVDDYATVPHKSVERLLALHNAAKLSVMTLGDDYEVERVNGKAGVVIAMKGRRSEFGAFIDATGQHAMSVCDLPFPSLRRRDALQEAATRKAQSGDIRRTGGIDLDDEFRPRAANGMSNQLYCVSVPFLLHKLPFVQGITSAHEIGTKVAGAIVSTIANAEHSLLGAFNQETTISSPTANEPSASDPA